MGFIGLTLSSVLAESGYCVNGIDILPKVIKGLKQKNIQFFEPGLFDLVKKHGNNKLKFFTEIPDRSCDYYIICVGTPIHNTDKYPNLEFLEKAVKSIGKFIKEGDTVILRSTVPVGTTRKMVKILGKDSSLIPGKDFYFGFVPERTVEGNAVHEIKRIPQIIGPFNENSRVKITKIFSNFNNNLIQVPDIEHAEMCKLVDNTFRDVLFSYANQLAIISESLRLDYNIIREASNKDYIRNNIPKASPGVGGACLTKDTYILSDTCRKLGIDASLLLSARHINNKIVFDLSKKILSRIESIGKNPFSSKIFILGFAFKGEPETSDTRFSTTIDLVDYLQPYCPNIYGYDSIASPKDIESEKVVVCSIEEGFSEADVVIIMNEHRELRNLDILRLSKQSKDPLIFIDCWNLYDKGDFNDIDNIIYSSIGLY